MYLHSDHIQAREQLVGTARIEPYLSSAAYFLVFLLLPYGLSVSRPRIGEALSNDTLDCSLSALHIVNSETDAVAIAEIELRKISVQMAFAAMLVNAFHATLEDRIEAFDSIGMDVPANVFLSAMVHALMAGEFGADLKILAGFVGHQCGFFGDVRANDWGDIGDGGTIDMEAAGAATAFDKGKNRILMAPSGAALGLARLTPDKGFIGLHNLASAAHGFDSDNAHGLPQTMRHEPSGFQGNTKGPMKLVAADTLFARAQQIHSLDPKPHWDVARFENGPYLYGELLAALVALVQADPGRVAAHLADALGAAAMRADRAVGPHMGFNPSVSRFLVVEGVGFDHGFRHGGQFLFVNQPYPRYVGLSNIISPMR
jgi:hypothetical protein